MKTHTQSAQIVSFDSATELDAHLSANPRLQHLGKVTLPQFHPGQVHAALVEHPTAEACARALRQAVSIVATAKASYVASFTKRKAQTALDVARAHSVRMHLERARKELI